MSGFNDNTSVETEMASSLRPVGFEFESRHHLNRSSMDSMHEISIQDSSHVSQRPATLPLESPFASVSTDSDDQSSANGVTGGGKLQTPMDQIKEWSLTTYKCTKQLVNEKLGKCQRTVDIDLEADIERLRETQHKYSLILKMTRDMSSQYQTIIGQQISLYECLNELAMKESKTNNGLNDDNTVDNGVNNSNNSLNLGTDFRQNAEMMRNVAKNGEKLLLALKFFTSNLTTLVHKTIEDTIITIKAYEMARLEYDAERNNSSTTTLTNQVMATEKLRNTKCKYDRLREDVIVKMKFLDENKAKVMHKQLILFHNAFAAFASGNATALDSTLKQFSIKAIQPSFLEK
ncbi:arfaptin-2-like [Oppia nitens]|uniref:arfaptin-2-like n=1 Tax=Oppia nitens TaxID=1686743 RepID=UPI0023DBB384|nr:arfaptin-2-like [Oppia nitens]